MKTTIGVFFGGKSTEHEVSVITGLQAFAAIDRDKYDVVPIYITKENAFFTGENIGKIEEYADIVKLLKKSTPVTLLNVTGRVGLYRVTSKKIELKKPCAFIDVALPAVHGTNVEDGTLQGYFETLGLAYAGCNILSSAVGMDKGVMKAVLNKAGVPVLDCLTFTAKRYIDDKDGVTGDIIEQIALPTIIKPVNLGSSIGIRIAKTKDDLILAIENALLFADVVLAEPAIVNLKEINCAVLGDKDAAEAGECEEPLVGNADGRNSEDGGILNFDDKYKSGEKNGDNAKAGGMASLKRKIPAELSELRREEIRTLAVKAFKALGCGGVARIDFLINLDTDELWFNEINTIPGSFAFYLFEPVGIKYSDLLDKMVKLALKREREKSNLNFSFENNILSAFKGGLKNKGKG
ncbi:MAG: D-alanine--D-alanine ligase [Oscillospiraceae bacterium]|nr:D-alanine--D-alanine ligase [Oscillospiraceae bacterium]